MLMRRVWPRIVQDYTVFRNADAKIQISAWLSRRRSRDFAGSSITSLLQQRLVSFSGCVRNYIPFQHSAERSHGNDAVALLSLISIRMPVMSTVCEDPDVD